MIEPWLEKVLTALLSLLAGFGLARFGKHRDSVSENEKAILQEAKRQVEERDKRIGEMEKRQNAQEKELAVMRAEAVPIAAAFLATIKAKAKHFHTPDLDKKIGKLKPDVALSRAETAELKKALKAEAELDDPLIDEEERLAKRILLDVQRMAVIESEKRASGEVSKLETLLVSQPAQTGGEETEKKDKEADGRGA